MTAGLGSGLTEGLVITPFERVKVYMQAQRNRMAVVSEMIMCGKLICQFVCNTNLQHWYMCKTTECFVDYTSLSHPWMCNSRCLVHGPVLSKL